MTVTVYYHPFSRAATTVWMLEEVGIDYELEYIDIMSGAQKQPAILALNPMGKLPILVDGDAVVTESAAIGLYLADRYALGRLAPRPDDPARGTYLRWSLFAPSVIEPGAMAKAGKWSYKEGSAGFGNYEAMMDTIEFAVAGKDFVLGDSFSMADVIFGGTVGFMLQFKMIDERPRLVRYVERINERPASERARAKNAAIASEHGLGK